MKKLRAFLVAFTTVVVVLPGDTRVFPRTYNALPARTFFSEPFKVVPGPEMNYTGFRVQENSMRVIYHHDQTISVLEVGSNPNPALINCELLEVKTTRDRTAALSSLKGEIPIQMEIGFHDMLRLMDQCQKMDIEINMGVKIFLRKKKRSEKLQGENVDDSQSFTDLFKGVYPGTKWCGAGNLATSYFGLGPERETDKCCRTHDFCPVKVSAFRTQYNITNFLFYTMSHCECDDIFFNCLKSVSSKASNFIGNIFFNVLKPFCVEDMPSDMNNMAPKRIVKRQKLF